MASFTALTSPKAFTSAFKFQILFTAWLLLGVYATVSNSQLSSSRFYHHSCPDALKIIWDELAHAIHRDPRLGASLTRLHFHDCFVLGCDASVLLDDNSTFTGEKTAFPNVNSIRGFEVVDRIKAHLEYHCPHTVSCADILAVAARDSVHILGGPYYNVQLGRRDSLTASKSLANSDLPPPFADLNALISSFANKGLNTQDMVALSGAHTFGKASCATFRARIYNDTNINSAYANSLKSNCPISGGDSNLANLDVTTPVKFDTAYYTNLKNQKGLLHSDQALFGGQSTDALVSTYSSNTSRFFWDFGHAMIKMGSISPLTGTSGQIRTNCRRTN